MKRMVVFLFSLVLAFTMAFSTFTSTQANSSIAMSKYNPPLKITATRWISDAAKFVEGETIENNKKTDYEYGEKLGIKLNYLWSVPQSQFDSKMAVTIASQDLADVMMLNMRTFSMLANNGKLQDLTDTYNKYGSKALKGSYETDEGASLSLAKVGGKLYAIPSTSSPADVAPVLWIRADWLKKLKLKEPTSMNDVFAIAEAFTKNDPDGNNKKDTFGMALLKDLYDTSSGGWVASLNGFFQGYHAYPNMWVKGSNGKLVYGSVQPNIGKALIKLQSLYKAGIIDPEFAVKDVTKIAEELTKGKLGLEFGAMWNPLWPLQGSMDADKNADWKPYAVPSIDKKPAAAGIGIDPNTMVFLAVKKGFKNPEVVVKMMNVTASSYYPFLFGNENDPDKYDGSDKTTEITNWYADKGITEQHQYLMGWVNPADKNIVTHRMAVSSIDNNKTPNVSIKQTVEDILGFEKDGDRSKWGMARVFGHVGSFNIIDNKYMKPKNTVFNEFYGAPTETMILKMQTLNKMQLEVYTKIIMGAPIGTFSKFVGDWHKLGGTQITKEVNEWKKAVSKK
jgi:putative aldouronate transport system substrate-binding protein